MTKKQLGGVLGVCLLAIMVVVPFHAVFTTWAGTNFGGLLIWRAWKEIFLAVLFLAGLVLFIADRRLRGTIWSRAINKVILAYAGWLLVAAALGSRDGDALLQGLAIDLRFVLFFVLFQIALFYRPITRRTLYAVLMIPYLGVVLFGLLQMFVLPKDFLAWFGYNKYRTIPPFYTIDEQQDVLRYASTLSGPNTLGAYLVLPTMAVVSKLRSFIRSKRRFLFMVSCLLLSTVVLYGSHSRSAWIAMAVSIATYIFVAVPRRFKVALLAAAVAGIILVGALGIKYQDTRFVQDVILHDNPEEGSEISSNLGHADALENGIEGIAEEPLTGCGIGCAGPASVRHEDGVNISENFYLQIGQESGVIGMALFMAIIVLLGLELYRRRADRLALAVFASLVGLSVANLLLHTWADDTLAYVWWGVAGMLIGQDSKAQSQQRSK